MGQTEIILFLILANIILVFSVAGIVIFMIKYRRRQLEHQTELFQNEQETREKTIRQISRDLHDEIGSSLSGISLFAQIAEQQLQNGQGIAAKDFLQKIKSYSDVVIEKTGDMIWMMQAENDTQDKLLQRLKAFAESLTKAKQIRLHFEADPAFTLPAHDLISRKNIYLICKEAINNAVKYSGCTSLTILFKQKTISISDNGSGFDIENLSSGHGLQNMQQRAKEANIHVDVHTKMGNDTTILLCF